VRQRAQPGRRKVGEDDEDAPVGVGLGAEAELLEDPLDVGFDGAFRDEQAGGDAPVGRALGNQREYLAFAFGELVGGLARAAA
jgi:hypothetical protein